MRSALVGWLLLSCTGTDPGPDSDDVADTDLPRPAHPLRPLPPQRIALPGDADATYVGGPGAGFRVAGLGDLDGDGADEVGVAEIYTTVGRAVGAGRVQILLGDPDGGYGPVVGPSWTGGEEYEWLGSDALAAGDVDGDGAAELLVGGLGFWLIDPPLQGGPVRGQNLSFPGNEAADLADLDGDGLDDLILQRGTQDDDTLAVWLGPPSPGREPDAEVTGGLEDRFGVTLATGDLDGDGADEVATGAPLAGEADQGAVYVYDANGLRQGEPLSFIGGAAQQRVGTTVTIPGDVDGDGRDDLIVGALAHDGDGGCGAITRPVAGALFTGLNRRATLADATARFLWTGPGCARAGEAVGDLDGDGLAEISFHTDEVAWILLDAPTGTMLVRGSDLRIQGPVGCCSLGHADVDGDGADDLILGRVPLEEAYERPGEVFFLLGPLR